MRTRTMKTAKFLGFDLSTTALSCGVRSGAGKEDFVSVPMRGKLKWHGQPAHDLSFVPGMILAALEKLQKRGWKFRKKGVLSFSVRQHDMVLLGLNDRLDSNDRLLMPALSWQCNAARKETAMLNSIPAVARVVGKVEPRFILPKLIWVMRKSRDIADKVVTVLTTGDYIAYCLTDKLYISTSDGLSNGLLNQRTKGLAKKALSRACSAFRDEIGTSASFVRLFPDPIQSGEKIGAVWLSPLARKLGNANEWLKVVRLLEDWVVISNLGDNHAGGVGCGLTDDRTIVISAGSSGTVIRKCKPNLPLAGNASCFEYYQDRLLLMMLADCATWYDRFACWYSGNEPPDLAALNRLASSVYPADLVFLSARNREKILTSGCLHDATVVASAQFSLVIELLLRAKKILAELKGKSVKVDKFVLTGGLSRSLFFQEVIKVGVGLLVPNADLSVSNRRGPLASQAATLGAIINAMVGGSYKDFTSAVAALCPLKPSGEVEPSRLEPLREVIGRALR